MKIFRYALKLVLFIFAVLALPQAQADEVLWKSGKNLHIKLTEQDEMPSGEQPPPNDHPVELSANEITNALNLMQIWNENYIRTNEAIRVFSIQQARILGEYIAKGLSQAGPEQDIVFALAKRERGFLSIETVEYMAGRAFYLNDKLNVIIGDYDKQGDRFQERVRQSHGMTDEINYYFAHGEREESVGFDERVIGKDGIRTYQGRSDWFLIDVPLASKTWLAEQREQEREQNGDSAATVAANEAYQREAARLSQERREMRLEMARMRKELEEAKQGENLTVKERLQRLEDLKNQDLITDQEYQQKRQTILDDL